MSDPSWHLSTPTPYDPPITYGGWNQSRSLGTRIASLLDAREKSYSNVPDGIHESELGDGTEGRPRKRRRLRHKVVIHTSPFLRCLQTSIAIAAGMAQYNPTIETGDKGKRPTSVSPRVRPSDWHSYTKHLAPIGEPKHDLAHAVALRALHDKRYRKSSLRVDAFLGEWLNPQYFEGITEPPPSAMMVATAKGELMENETVEIFHSNANTKPSNNTLWGGLNGTSNLSRESTLDDWSHVEETLPRSPSRSRASTQTDVRDGAESGRKSPFRPGSVLQPLTSTVPKPETSTYHPPTPQYAVSPAQQIPRGYVAHARNACTDVDLQWDSSREPEPWGDGGEYGEEWSAMHKRIRRGLNHLVQWYSKEDNDDAIAGHRPVVYEDEEMQEDLVVVLVTHGAGANALIGALTGQPVLLDVGMASLSMAVRRDDAPTSFNPIDNFGRRNSSDGGLSSLYEVKFVSSSEHLRAGPDSKRGPSAANGSVPFANVNDRSGAPRSNTNASLGSIRRPSAVNAHLSSLNTSIRSSSLPRDNEQSASPTLSAGLWTPPTSRPTSSPRFLPLTETSRGRVNSTGEPVSRDFAGLPPPNTVPRASDPVQKLTLATSSSMSTVDDEGQKQSTEYDSDASIELPKPGDEVPAYLGRRLSQEALWGSKPSGAKVERKIVEPKRRWTVDQD